jgi:hypothetical protein
MNRTLSRWIFGVVEDTARSALMLVLAGAAISLEERSRSQRQVSGDTGHVVESLQRTARLSTAESAHHTRVGLTMTVA